MGAAEFCARAFAFRPEQTAFANIWTVGTHHILEKDSYSVARPTYAGSLGTMSIHLRPHSKRKGNIGRLGKEASERPPPVRFAHFAYCLLIADGNMPHVRSANCCNVPECNNNSLVNSSLSFHAPKDESTKRMWEAAIRSHDLKPPVKLLNVNRVCSSHFAEDAYETTDILRAKFGMPPKRMRLKAGAVPTIFKAPHASNDIQPRSTSTLYNSEVSLWLSRESSSIMGNYL